jgi:CBS domain-containing protein
MANKMLLTIVNGDRVVINSNATAIDFLSVTIDGILVKKTGTDLDLGNVKLTNIVAGSAAGHAVEYSQLNTALGNYIPSSEKGQPLGVAELDATGKVPAAQLPAAVDPLTVALTGLVTSSGGVLVAADTILEAFGKLEYRMALNDAKVTYDVATARADLIASSIADGDTDHAPSGDAVFDALALKLDTANFGTEFDAALALKSTDNVTEGTTNLYFTDLRAQTAVVSSSISSGDTDHAPSSDAVFTALGLKLDTANFGTEFDSAFALKSTDGLAEGSTNLYFTDERAKTAAVSDSITDGVIDVAPSQNAVFDALALKANAADVLPLAGGTMSGDIDMDGNVVTGLPSAAVGASDATSKAYVDAQDALKLSLTGGTMSGDIAMGNNDITGAASIQVASVTVQTDGSGGLSIGSKVQLGGNLDLQDLYKVVNLATPTASDDAATKGYVDSAVGAVDLTPYLKKDGTVTVTGDLNIGGKELQNVKKLWIDESVDGSTPMGSIFKDGSDLKIAAVADLKLDAGTGNAIKALKYIDMGALKITSTHVPSASADLVNKTYVDNLITGIQWKNSVEHFNILGNASAADLEGMLIVGYTSKVAGDEWVITTGGTMNSGALTVAAGDIVEWSGSAWVKIDEGVGGFVDSDTRAILGGAGRPLFAPYTEGSDNDKIISFSGSSNVGADTGETAVQAAVLVSEDPNHVNFSIYNLNAYVYTASGWTQFAGANQIVAGAGLQRIGNTISIATGGVTDAMLSSTFLKVADFTDAAVTGKLLTGFVAGVGTSAVLATDSILAAFQKLQGSVADAKSVADAALPSASFTDAAVTGKLLTGFVSGAGTVAATDTILDAIEKLDGNVVSLQSDGLSVRSFVNANAGAITARQIAFVTALGEIDLAKADDVLTGADQVLVVVKDASIASAATGQVYFRGAVVPGFSSLTIGATYFISAATAGDITAVAPSASGDYVYKVGRAISATEILFEPEYRYSIA